MSKNGISRNKRLSDHYKTLLQYKCANPDCRGKSRQIDAHHITPLHDGGADAFWNLVCLCKSCHCIGGLHSKHEDWTMTLNVWKSRAELRTLGFYMDEQESGFPLRYHEAMRKAGLDGEEVVRTTLRGVNFGEKGDDGGNA